MRQCTINRIQANLIEIKKCFHENRRWNHLGKKTIISNRTNHELIKPVQSLFRSGSVIISTVDNIYDNLALEEWIYRNYDFSVNDEQILLIWRNRSSVVVGRHQNIWLETSLDYCRNNKIDLARRNSGGGTVYHDINNLNVSFFTSRKCYNRTFNLNFLCDILRRCFQIATEISPRKDLVVTNGNQKISGTASKLNGYNSYHHCTLLVDVDREQLRQSLRLAPIENVFTNATKSVPSPIINLNCLNKSITIQSLIEAISNNYGQFYTGKPEPPVINRLDRIDSEYFGNVMNDIQAMFRSWQWIYGTTPKFSIHQKISLHGNEFLKIHIEKGKISNIELDISTQPILELQEKINHIFLKCPFEEKNLMKSFEILRQQNLQPPEIVTQLSLAIFTAYQKLIF